MCRIIFGSEIRPEPKMATYGDFWCKARIPHKLMIAQETAEHKGRACTRRWCYPLRTSGKRGDKRVPPAQASRGRGLRRSDYSPPLETAGSLELIANAYL